MQQHRFFNWIGTLGIASFALLLNSQSAFAEISVKVVENGRYSALDTSEKTPVIYAGVSGDESDCTSPSTTGTCNTCSGELKTCNKARIHATLRLQLQVTSDATNSGGDVMLESDDGTSSESITTVSISPQSPSKDETATVTVEWGAICSVIDDFGDSTECDVTDSATKSLRLGIDLDNNGELDNAEYKTIKIIMRKGPTETHVGTCDEAEAGDGICYFEVNSGDQSAVLEKLEATSGFPTNGNFAAVRVCYKERTSVTTGVWDQITLSDCKTDLPITSGDPVTVSPKRVSGLTNDSIYDFLIGMVDDAGNVGLFTDPDDAQTCNDSTGSTSSDSGLQECRTARPSDVVALLNDKVNCFVATAAYGSPMAAEVGTLRKFRDHFLAPTKLGKAFIRFYYHEGPKVARFIAKSDALRAISRAMIYPFLMFATIALQYGGATALAISLAGSALLIGFIMIARRFSRRMSA